MIPYLFRVIQNILKIALGLDDNFYGLYTYILHDIENLPTSPNSTFICICLYIFFQLIHTD